MGELIQFGPIVVNGQLLMMLIAFACSLGVLYIVIRSIKMEDSSFWMDRYITGGVISFIVWKFGVLGVEPSILWTAPMKLLFTSGTIKEFILGACIGFSWISIQLVRKQLSLQIWTDLCTYGVLSFSMVYLFLNPIYGKTTEMLWGFHVAGGASRVHPVHIYLILLLILISIRLWRMRTQIGRGRIAQEFLTYYGLAGLLSSLFAVTESTRLGLSSLQWMYMCIAISGILYLKISEKMSIRRSIQVEPIQESQEQLEQQKNSLHVLHDQDTPMNESDKKNNGPNQPAD